MPIGYVAAATPGYQNGGTSVTATLPVGASVGDTVLAFGAMNDVTAGDPTISGGDAAGSWVQVGATTDDNTLRTKVWRRTVVAGDAGATITMSWSSLAKAGLELVVYSGASADAPISAVEIETGSDGTHNAPGVTPTVPGCWIVEYVAQRSAACTTITAPVSPARTERAEQLGSGSGTVCQIAADSNGTVPASVASGSATYTFNETTGNAVGWSIALAPDTEAHTGAGTITGTLAMSAAGTPDTTGAGALSGTLALSGTGTVALSGAGGITGLLTLTASGRADTGIGRPPRPRTRWQLVLGAAGGGHELALTAARSRKYVAKLTESSELTFNIDGRHPQAASIEQLLTDVHLLWTSDAGQTRILDRTRVGQPRDILTEDSHSLSVDTMDYREVLNRRILYAADVLTWAGTDQAEIAMGLITQTQDRNSGDLGIARGWTGSTPTGILRDRTYEAGDSIGQRIQELSEVIDGFEWDILPASPSALRLDIWYPQRGTQRGVVLEYGGLIASASREESAVDYVNALRYTGGGDPAPAAREYEDPRLGLALGGLPQGRWEKAFGDDGLTTDSALRDRAQWQLQESQVIRPTYTVRLRRGAWDGPDHIWIGDTVRLIIRSGRLAVDTSLRVYEVQIDIGDDGQEDITLALGGPRPDYRRRATLLERRITDLERR